MGKWIIALLGIHGFALFLGFSHLNSKLIRKTGVDERPRDVWVMRSVLDKKPRILSIALHRNLYVAYDTEKASFYKAWSGTINFDGSVFNGVHGFQPTSQGAVLLTERDQNPWTIQSKGKIYYPKIKYQGHRLFNGQVTLMYDLLYDNAKVHLEETPEYFNPEGQSSGIGLQKTYKIIGDLAGATLMCRVKMGAIREIGDFNTDGKLMLNDKRGVSKKAIPVRDIIRIVVLNADKATTMSWRFPNQNHHSPSNAVSLNNGAVMSSLIKSDCFNCHHKEIRTVGPSFSEISGRYQGKEEEFSNRLALKIIYGGAGNWGSAPMPPHPDLSVDLAARFVKYILSVDPPKKASPGKAEMLVSPHLVVDTIPGDGFPLTGVHPSFDLTQARPDWFKPRVGGMDFLPDGRLLVSTWDSLGAVYLLDGLDGKDRKAIKVKRIASGLAEPLGLKVVDGNIYVLQKQELTRLVDLDGDDIIDEYRTVCNSWRVSDNFHEFSFGLAYQDGYFYATLATDVNNGGASSQPQVPDRGKVIKIAIADGSLTFVATGLRTPNGIGQGPEGELFITDNQGDWLPANKIIHFQQGAWYGSRVVDFEGTRDMKETPPAVWLPHEEIANSPSQPILFNIGPYRNQLLYGDVTYGGIQRVFLEKIDGVYQGAVFRFSQGLEAGINRLVWGPDGGLFAGGIGLSWGWAQKGKLRYSLQRLGYNGKTTFEILAVRAKYNGIEIELTKPLGPGRGTEPSSYSVKQWWYKPTENYGGPKMQEEVLSIKQFRISQDRKIIFLELPQIKPGHVVYIHLNRDSVVSADGDRLWSTEAWYTMNKIPASVGSVNH